MKKSELRSCKWITDPVQQPDKDTTVTGFFHCFHVTDNEKYCVVTAVVELQDGTIDTVRTDYHEFKFTSD